MGWQHSSVHLHMFLVVFVNCKLALSSERLRAFLVNRAATLGKWDAAKKRLLVRKPCVSNMNGWLLSTQKYLMIPSRCEWFAEDHWKHTFLSSNRTAGKLVTSLGYL